MKTSILNEEGQRKVLEHADLLLHVQDYVLPQYQKVNYAERSAHLVKTYKELFYNNANLELEELKDAYDNTEH